MYKKKEVTEKEFRDIVLESHKDGHFRGDKHKMYANFKLHKNSVDFKAIVYLDDNNKVIAFCGLDIFVTSKGDKKGMIHCQGVIQEYRGKGISVKLLYDVEDIGHPDMIEILSICNPISAGAHKKAGYIVTNPGRVTATGKISQIRLKKVL